MHRKLVIYAAIFAALTAVHGVYAQDEASENSSLQIIPEANENAEGSVQEGNETTTYKNYLINFGLRISDDSGNTVLDSSWKRLTVSGKPVSINLKANNLQIAAIFIPYHVDEKSVILLAQGKVMLKPVNYTEGKYYSTVDSLPLRIGEKALFFPLGLLDEKMENISSCVLEIEVQHCDKIDETTEEENFLLEPEYRQNQPGPGTYIKKQ